MSRKFSVVRSATLAPRRVRSAFSPTVVPWTKKSIPAPGGMAISMPRSTATPGSSGVERTFVAPHSPVERSWKTMSVNVPPMSIPMRYPP